MIRITKYLNSTFIKFLCTNNVKSLPVWYCASKKSQMTSSLFEEDLRLWDRELARKNRRIFLLVDNYPTHPKLIFHGEHQLNFLTSKHHKHVAVNGSMGEPRVSNITIDDRGSFNILNLTTLCQLLCSMLFLSYIQFGVKFSNCFRYAFESNVSIPETLSKTNLPQTPHLLDVDTKFHKLRWRYHNNQNSD